KKILYYGNGSVGRFNRDTKLAKSFNHLLDLTEKLRENIENGQGALGKFSRDNEFQQRIDQLQARIDKLSTHFHQLYDQTQHGQGAVAKFTSDTKFSQQLKDLSAHLGTISRQVDQSKGTVGLFIHDPRLNENMDLISTEMLKLFYDIGQKPTKYVKFKF